MIRRISLSIFRMHVEIMHESVIWPAEKLRGRRTFRLIVVFLAFFPYDLTHSAQLDAARLMTSPREPQSIDLSGDLEPVRDDCHPDAAMMATNDPDNEDLELSQSSTSLVLSPEVTLEEPSSSERRTLQVRKKQASRPLVQRNGHFPSNDVLK